MSKIYTMLLGLLAVAMMISIGCRTGKRTFQSQKIDSADSCVAGVPTQVYTLHKVQVQWRVGGEINEIDEGRTTENELPGKYLVQPVSHQAANNAPPEEIHVTTHFCRLPIAYAVDAIGTPFGTDEAKIELNADGTLKMASEKRDHQIDELITSVTEAADTILPKLPGTRTEMGEEGNPYSFYPALPAQAEVIAILEITPLQ